MNYRHAAQTLVLLSLAASTKAHGQIPVIDVEALVQLQQQITYWQQQLSSMSTQVLTSEQQLAATTGTRGMGALLALSAAQRNYLPSTATGILSAMAATQPTDPALRSAYVGAIGAQSGISPQSLASLSLAEQNTLTARRAAIATRSSVMQAALATASQRFSDLQGLINQIDLTTDQKGSLDLQGRIAAEAAMTANESAKLAAVAAWSDASIASVQTLAHEAALTAHGSFAGRFRPTAP